jgi:hypothetical protein
MRRKRSLIAVLGFLLNGIASVEAGIVYNDAADFSATTNPNDVWSYGYLAAGSSPVSSTFTAYGDKGTVGGSIEYWNISGGGLNPPEIFYNSSNNVVQYSTITMQPHQAAFHPGPSDQYSDYRFIAPQSGTYTLSVTFIGIDDGGTTTDVHVLENGTSLFIGNINGYGNTATFSTTLTLANAALIDFAVGYGSNHNYFDDSTGINATLTLTGASVPEPGSIILLGEGSLSLLGCVGGYGSRRRRRVG